MLKSPIFEKNKDLASLLFRITVLQFGINILVIFGDSFLMIGLVSLVVAVMVLDNFWFWKEKWV